MKSSIKPSITETSLYIKKVGLYRFDLVESIYRFCISLQGLISIEVPKYTDTFQNLYTLLNDIAEANCHIAYAEINVAETLHNIITNFDTVSKLTHRYFALIEEIEKLTQELNDAKAKREEYLKIIQSDESQDQSLDAMTLEPLRALLIKKQKALIKVKEVTDQLIKARTTYNEYKLSSYRNCFTVYATTIAKEQDIIAQKFRTIAFCFQKIREFGPMWSMHPGMTTSSSADNLKKFMEETSVLKSKLTNDKESDSSTGDTNSQRPLGQ